MHGSEEKGQGRWVCFKVKKKMLQVNQFSASIMTEQVMKVFIIGHYSQLSFKNIDLLS